MVVLGLETYQLTLAWDRVTVRRVPLTIWGEGGLAKVKKCVRIARGVPCLEDGFGWVICAMLISAQSNLGQKVGQDSPSANLT